MSRIATFAAVCFASAVGYGSGVEAASPCLLSDLAGNWVFRLDFPGDQTKTHMNAMVCPVTIRPDGTMPDASCFELDQQTNRGKLLFSGHFSVTSGCVVQISGSSFDAPYFLSTSTFIPYSVTGLRAWLSPDRMVFMGAFSFDSGQRYAIGVLATKR
jgi:hypothetical protein